MTQEDWNGGFAKALGIFLNGEGIQSPDSRGERVVDESFYVLFNAHHEPLQFTLPKRDWGEEWVVALDTARPTLKEEEERHKAGDEVSIESRSLKVLCRVH
jgi:glycogen operon protein